MIFSPAEFPALVARSPWFGRPALSPFASQFASQVKVVGFLPGETFAGGSLGLIVSGRVEVTYGVTARTTTPLSPGDLLGVHDAVAGSAGASAARQALGEPVVERHRALTSGYMLQWDSKAALAKSLVDGLAEILVIRCSWRRFAAWMSRTLGGMDGVPVQSFSRVLPAMRVNALGPKKVAAPDQLWVVLDGELEYEWPGVTPPGVPSSAVFPMGSYGLPALWPAPGPASAMWQGLSGDPCWVLSVSNQSLVNAGLGPLGHEVRPATLLTAMSMSTRLAAGPGFFQALHSQLQEELGASVGLLNWEANGEVSGPVVPFTSLKEAAHQLAASVFPTAVLNRIPDLLLLDPTGFLTTHTVEQAVTELANTSADTSLAVLCDSAMEWHRRLLKFGGDQGLLARPVYVQPSRARVPLWASLVKSRRRSLPFPDETVRIRPSSGFASAPSYATASAKDLVAVGRIGRLLARRLVGVALGGGGALSFTAVPLLRELHRLDIPVDAVSGTSFGSYMAGFYATNGVDGLTTLERQAWVLSWVMPWTLFTTRHMGVMVDAQTGGFALEDTDIPFFSVATNAFSFAAETVREGTVGFAVRASGSLPPFAPMVSAGKRMIDGFFSEDVPGRTLREAGCDLVVGANPMAVPDAVQSFTEFVLAGMRNADILTESNPTVRMWDWMRTTQRIYGFAGSHTSEDVDVDYVTQVGPTMAQGAWFAMGPFISAAARRTHALRLAVAETQIEWRARQFSPEPRWLHDPAKNLLWLKGTLVMEPPSAQSVLFGEPLALHAYDQALLEELAFAAIDAGAKTCTLVIGWDTSVMSLPPWFWGTPVMWFDFLLRYRMALAAARGIERHWAKLSAELSTRQYKGVPAKPPLLSTRVERLSQAAVTVELA